ncbi:hypothetical protein [Fluviicola sp.]|uniref:hypothetical protein n=1 Tax=Fluviicola sp. TaxID=1917219 RepID=UPI00282BEB97|nr:hypothetical protein [Fluviicola sp.]MDR0801329.1 hypothetical protein [Fluviicola sp.]
MRVLIIAGFFGSMALLGNTYGQYEKVYYNDTTFETESYKVEIDNIVALPKEVKFRMSVTNKTSDWVLYNPNESKFEIGGESLDTKDKFILIPPYDSKKKVLRAVGVNLNNARSFNFVCEGFYKVTLKEAVATPEFRLPASSNELVVGNFKIILANSLKETRRTIVKFNITYNGEGLAFISPAKISVKMPDGNLYATTRSKADVFAIKKGETESTSASWDRMEGGTKMDMQLVEMLIHFEGVFQESTQTKIDKTVIPLYWNDALTIGKGKSQGN